ncbi:hypothetical protein D3C85_662130 [compost metagenome]
MAEIRVIAIAISALVLKTFAHAALPAPGHFDPGVSPARPLFFSQRDLHFHDLTRQLIEGVRRERTTLSQVALCVGFFAVEYFDDAPRGPRGAKQPLALAEKRTFTRVAESALVLLFQLIPKGNIGAVRAKLSAGFAIARIDIQLNAPDHQGAAFARAADGDFGIRLVLRSPFPIERGRYVVAVLNGAGFTLGGNVVDRCDVSETGR